MRRISLLCLLALVPLQSYSLVQQERAYVRISAINNIFNPDHPSQIEVHPGDRVRLTADIFDESHYAAQSDSADDFLWIEEQSGDRCDLSGSGGRRCPHKSHFEATDDGVIFNVPFNMKKSVIITVIAKNAGVVELRENERSDSLILRNAEDFQQLTTIPLVCPPAPAPTPCPVSEFAPCPVRPQPSPPPTPNPDPLPTPSPVAPEPCPIPGPVKS